MLTHLSELFSSSNSSENHSSMEFHRPQDAWWLCTGRADVCTTAASLLLILSLAQLGHAGHQPDIFVSGDSFELPGQENTTLTLVLFLLCFHPPYLKVWALSCYGLERLRCESHVSCLNKTLCVLKGWNHIHMWSNLWYKKVLKWHHGTCQKHIQSAMRTFRLSRHTNQAQINQLWLCKIFLIQPFKRFGRIGKNLKAKRVRREFYCSVCSKLHKLSVTLFQHTPVKWKVLWDGSLPECKIKLKNRKSAEV